jgi:cellulase
MANIIHRYHDTRSDDIIASSHKGPITVYIAEASTEGTGAVWTKIAESGYSNGVWAVDTLISNKGKHSVTLPSTLAAGDYLLRAEIIGLHEADTDYEVNSARGAQFYPSCSQVTVTSGGSTKPPGTFNFVGGYTGSDPGIVFNLYGSFTSYTIPGPAVWDGSASTDDASSTSAAAATTSVAAVKTSSTAAVVKTTTYAAAIVKTSSTAAAVKTTTAAAVKTSSTKAAAVKTSSTAAAVKTTTAAAVKTSSTKAAATSAVKTTTKATTAVPTTLVTKTKATSSSSTTNNVVTYWPTTITTSTAAAATTTKTSAEINKCLDAVNECIAQAQSSIGGVVDFSPCEERRAACY